MNRKRAYLQAMGIPVWKPRRKLPFAKQSEEVSSVIQKPITEPVTADVEVAQPVDWELLKQQVSQCTACELHQSRNKPVFGVGNIHADWMIIGEAPGADEDAKGEPFVGRAGKLLDQMLLAIGVSRQEVFIANILKCRPPNNRDPKAEEVECCSSFLVQQIRTIKPKVILAVGRIAAQNLLQSQETIGKLRGKVLRFEETSTPLVATYHPAYLLRSPTEKSKAWSDLVLAKHVLMELSSKGT